MAKRPPRLVVRRDHRRARAPDPDARRWGAHQRVASPAELARELGRSVRHVTYHLEVLEKLGCIELVERNPAGGAASSRASTRARPAPGSIAGLGTTGGREERVAVTCRRCSLVSADLAEAMVGDDLRGPADNHVSRTPMVVDDAGWDEVVTLLASTLDELLDIQSRASNRIGPETETRPPKSRSSSSARRTARSRVRRPRPVPQTESANSIGDLLGMPSDLRGDPRQHLANPLGDRPHRAFRRSARPTPRSRPVRAAASRVRSPNRAPGPPHTWRGPGRAAPDLTLIKRSRQPAGPFIVSGPTPWA